MGVAARSHRIVGKEHLDEERRAEDGIDVARREPVLDGLALVGIAVDRHHRVDEEAERDRAAEIVRAVLDGILDGRGVGERPSFSSSSASSSSASS